jgi:hypothetical protein
MQKCFADDQFFAWAQISPCVFQNQSVTDSCFDTTRKGSVAEIIISPRRNADTDLDCVTRGNPPIFNGGQK